MAVIGIVQLKGGAGRSTLATNLAVGLGENVTLVDADMPQGTAASWAAVRDAQPPTLVTVDSHRQLLATLESLRKAAHVVIDAPPRIAEMTRALVMASDVLLIPLTPSLADVWAVQDLLETVAQARKERRGLEARIVWNRYRGYTLSAQELRQAVRKELPVDALRSTLGYRVAYVDALAAGKSVLEWHDAKAKDEMQALTSEVKRLVA